MAASCSSRRTRDRRGSSGESPLKAAARKNSALRCRASCRFGFIRTGEESASSHGSSEQSCGRWSDSFRCRRCERSAWIGSPDESHESVETGEAMKKWAGKFFNVLTRSASKDLHAAVFGYYRNDSSDKLLPP